MSGDLQAALEEANLPTLLCALAHMTGEDRWLRPPYRPAPARGAGDNDDAGLPPTVQEEVRAEALKVLEAMPAGTIPAPPPPTPERLVAILSASLGVNLPDTYGPLLAEELGVADRIVDPPDRAPNREFSAVVVGAGFSGLVAAISLRRAGIPVTVLERNDSVGGTWLENSYPGCGVDTPTHLYSFSFAQRPDWSRYFAKRDELFAYAEDVADEFDVRECIRFGTEVTGANWDEDAALWRLDFVDRWGGAAQIEANVLITGVGFFGRPAMPSIPGLEEFTGQLVHTARWPADIDLHDKRVAVLGTGASAMQLVPAIADDVGRLTVFQRSPQWGIPHPNYKRPVSAATRTLMEAVPHYLEWYRLRLLWEFGDKLFDNVQRDPHWTDQSRSISERNDDHRHYLTEYIQSELGDRTDLLDKCVPDYPPYGKRPLLDNGWFRTVARDDVDLVTDSVRAIEGDRVITETGEEFEVDVLVLATGFEVQRMLAPMEIRGRDGVLLREAWGDDDPRAYLGITVPDFPNMFVLLGPNTFAGHGGSGILSIELQMRYVTELLALMLERDLASVEPRPEVHDAYNAELDAALEHTIWSHPGMTTYYRNSRGRIVVPMPWTNLDYWERTRHPRLADYVVTELPVSTSVAAPANAPPRS